jgi:hypothetical protein
MGNAVNVSVAIVDYLSAILSAMSTRYSMYASLQGSHEYHSGLSHSAASFSMQEKQFACGFGFASGKCIGITHPPFLPVA